MFATYDHRNLVQSVSTPAQPYRPKRGLDAFHGVLGHCLWGWITLNNGSHVLRDDVSPRSEKQHFSKQYVPRRSVLAPRKRSTSACKPLPQKFSSALPGSSPLKIGQTHRAQCLGPHVLSCCQTRSIEQNCSELGRGSGQKSFDRPATFPRRRLGNTGSIPKLSMSHGPGLDPGGIGPSRQGQVDAAGERMRRMQRMRMAFDA
jgi:hypothetical protein